MSADSAADLGARQARPLCVCNHTVRRDSRFGRNHFASKGSDSLKQEAQTVWFTFVLGGE
jgi:hypothetical protein